VTTSSRWLTAKTSQPKGLLLVNAVGLWLFRNDVTRAAAKHTGRPWKVLYREGWRVVPVNVREAR